MSWQTPEKEKSSIFEWILKIRRRAQKEVMLNGGN